MKGREPSVCNKYVVVTGGLQDEVCNTTMGINNQLNSKKKKKKKKKS